MKKIYFAAPLFNDAEKEFNLKVTAQLEKLGFEVYLPQRDGGEAHAEPFLSMSHEERAKTIFQRDVDAVNACDICLIVLDGRVPDEGAAFELGLAYAKNKTLIGLKTDVRGMSMAQELNIMLSQPLSFLAHSVEELVEKIKLKA